MGAGSIYSSSRSWRSEAASEGGGIEGLQDRFSRIRAEARRRESGIRAEIAAVCKAHANVLRERKRIVEQRYEQREERSRMEAECLAAQETEDFVEADRLQEAAARAVEVGKRLEIAAASLSKESESMDERRHLLEKELITCWGDCAAEMERASRGSVSEFERAVRDWEREADRNGDEVEDRMQQAKRMLEHVRLDTERIEEEKQEVMRAVEGKTLSQSAELQGLVRKRETIRSEVAELMRLLKAKQDEEAGLSTRINVIEGEIEGVREQYGAKIARLEEREKVAERERAECEREVCIVKEAENECKEKKKRMKERSVPTP